MRRSLTAVVALAGVLLAACGGGSSSTEPTSAASPTGAAPTTEAVAEAFPVTIEHKYGSTTVEAKPERIVVVGLTEQDALLALGEVPVATTEWFGEQPGAIWPWATDALGDATMPEVLSITDGIEFERVASFEPDVIIALVSGMTQEDYDTLSAIAPTVAQPGDIADWGVPWDQVTLTVGQIVGKNAQAQALVDQTNDYLAGVRAEHPEFSGKEAVVVTPWEGIWAYGPMDNRGRLVTDLGFTFPQAVTDAIGDAFGATLSNENVDILDVDTLVWLHNDVVQGPKDLAKDPVYSKLAVHKDGREVHVASNEPLGASTSFVTVLSMPFLIDKLAPAMSNALAGNGPVTLQ